MVVHKNGCPLAKGVWRSVEDRDGTDVEGIDFTGTTLEYYCDCSNKRRKDLSLDFNFCPMCGVKLKENIEY